MTYIIKTGTDEYYCGRCTDFNRRLSEHLAEIHPGWFSRKPGRKIIINSILFYGNHENLIKKIGCKKVYLLVSMVAPSCLGRTDEIKKSIKVYGQGIVMPRSRGINHARD